MPGKERDNQLIAQRIRQVRKGLNLLQDAFAERLGFDQTTISKWEGGKARPTPDALVRIAGIAEADTDKLFFLTHAGIPDQFFMGEKMIPELAVASSRVIHRATRESGIPPSIDQKVPWDRELLTFVIETVNGELKKRGRKLPDRKYATLIALYYELCCQTGRRETGMVEQLLRIA